MDGRARWLRLRAVVSSWSSVLLIVLLACIAVGGYATVAAHADTGTTQQQRQVQHWTVTGGFDHSATVTRSNPVFPVGTELTNRSTYFMSVSPVLDGSFRLRYRDRAAGDGPVSVTLDAAVVTQSAGENEVFWTERTPIPEKQVTSVASGETTTISFSVNASQVAQRRAEIRETLGESPGEVRTFVAVTVNSSGTAGESPTSLTFTRRLPLTIAGDTYSVGETQPVQRSATTTEMVAVPRTYGFLWSLGGPLLLVGGFLGAGLLAFAHHEDRLALSEAERDLLDFRADRSEFDEWIVRLNLPDAVFDRPQAQAESLADLVDFAIDADRGVVEAPETGTFYVVTPDLLAVYEPPTLAQSADGSQPANLAPGLRDVVTQADSGRPESTDEAPSQDDGSQDSTTDETTTQD